MSGTSQRFVAYERVSTKRQGASGLGLEAQRKAIDDFVASRGAEVIARFTEVESGKLADRPELGKALHLAKVTGAVLLIAKLDRLSRNAAFLLTLRDSGVRFVAADMPEANDLTVGIMALVAEQEREAITRRTKEALAAARARGVKLGNPNGAASVMVEFHDGDELVMVSVIDQIDDGISAVYTFFDPARDRDSLGVYGVLWQIELAKRLELPYLYLGYWIGESPKMAYKQQYPPLEGLIDGRWQLMAPTASSD
jgi:DNA invertase Pin-like site-specific DNA recombinase